MATQFYLTNIGKQAALAGNSITVNLQTLQVGSGRYNAQADAPNMTELQHPLASFGLNGGGVVNNNLRLNAMINSTITADVYEIGLFLDSGKLFAVASTTGNDPLMRLINEISSVVTLGISLNEIDASKVNISVENNSPISIVLMNTHEAAANPHPQYATDADLNAHIVDANPHPQYATDGDLAVVDGRLTQHINAADPHPQYVTSPELETRLSTVVGQQGIQGIQGIQGEKGDKGDKGDTGAQGIQGIQGEKGDKGDTGAQGIQGVKGDKGDKGDTGSIDQTTLNSIIARIKALEDWKASGGISGGSTNPTTPNIWNANLVVGKVVMSNQTNYGFDVGGYGSYNPNSFDLDSSKLQINLFMASTYNGNTTQLNFAFNVLSGNAPSKLYGKVNGISFTTNTAVYPYDENSQPITSNPSYYFNNNEIFNLLKNSEGNTLAVILSTQPL